MAAKFLPPSKLITAIRAGNLSEVTETLNNGADLEEADIHGFVGLPLRTACFEGNIEIVQELLNRGANINALAGDGPNAPMRLAQRGKHAQVIALLVQHGAIPADTGPKIMAEPTALFPTRKQASATVLETLPQTQEPAVAENIESKEMPDELVCTDNLIEYSPTPIPPPAIEELDLTACYGVDTNLLDFDLQRLQDVQDAKSLIAPEPEAAKPKSKFWSSGTDK